MGKEDVLCLNKTKDKIIKTLNLFKYKQILNKQKHKWIK